MLDDGGDIWTNGTGLGTTDFTDVAWGKSAGLWFATAVDGGLWQTRDGSTWGPMDLHDVAAIDSDFSDSGARILPGWTKGPGCWCWMVPRSGN